MGLDGFISFGSAKITKKGLDFIADDGGLSAILNIVTVKLHADTIRKMLSSKIATQDISHDQKMTLLQRVKGASEKALEAATTDLIQKGLHQIPDFVTWLQKVVGL